jgi:iron complex outermembrane receptor protein
MMKNGTVLHSAARAAALACTSLVGAGALLTAPVAAQQTASTTIEALDDIVVTARFRNENLQSTPLSVSAIDGTTLSKFAITDVQSVQRFLPNVQLSRISFAGNALGASIRGISFADLEKTFDAAIGVAIDGVFLGTNTGANIDFNDIEGIEVLRGPQGTLYGRNTIGGTISVRRTRPTGELGLKLHGRYGSYGTYDLDAVANLPKFGDVLSVKLFGLYRQSDSFTRNRFTGEREPGRDYWNVGAAFKFDVGEDTSILASVDYQKDRSFYPSVINLTKANGLPFGAGGTICDFTKSIGLGDLACDTQGVIRQRGEQFKLANTSLPFKSWIDGWNASLELNSKIGDWSLTAITGYRDTTDILLEENSGTPPVVLGPGISLPLFVAARDQTYKQFSQEVRISGDITDWMDLVAGVYYLHTDYKIKPGNYLGNRTGTAFILNGAIQNFYAAQKLDSFAVFAESIFKLGNEVRLTVGGRYTTEKKKFSIEQLSAPAFTAAAEKRWSDPTGRVILDWKPEPNVMFYGSWSRGFRSGGFNGRATSATSIGPYDPERVDSFEAGMKGDFFDGRIRVNPTVFWADYTNKQEEIIRASGAGTETVVENAASARIRGIELELQAKPVNDLLLRMSVGYLDAKYKSFLIPDLANPGQFLDVAGQRNFRRAPELTFTMGADYTLQLNDSNDLNFSINYSFMDDIYTSPQRDTTGDRRDVIRAFGTLDAAISLLHTSGAGALKNFRINAYGRDLLNGGGRLSNTLDAGVFWFGVVSPRRELGIEATVNF